MINLLPTENGAREVICDTDPAKRKKLVEQLMEGEFAEFWALKWADLLNVEVRTLDPRACSCFTAGSRRIADNTPLDEFARSIISARSGTPTRRPTIFARSASRRNWLGPPRRCSQETAAMRDYHNHPFDRWTQGDYYDWASAFAKIDYKLLKNVRKDSLDKHEFNGEQVVCMKTGAT